MILIVAMTLPTLAAYSYFNLFTEPETVSTLYSLSKIIQFSLPLIAVLWIQKRKLSWVQPQKKDIIFGLGLGLIMLTLLMITYNQLSQFSFIPEAALLIRQKLEAFHANTPLKYFFLACFISILHSFLEEYYWRWYVHNELRAKLNVTAASIISSLAFTGHHVIVIKAYLPESIAGWGIYFFPAFVFCAGLFWALIYEKWKNLWIPWISHFLADVAILWIGYQIVWKI